MSSFYKRGRFAVWIFSITRTIEFVVILASITVSEFWRTTLSGKPELFTWKTVLFIPTAFYVGFGYFLVSLVTFVAISLVGFTRARLIVANIVPLILWWPIVVLYIYGREVPLPLVAAWLLTVGANALVAWMISPSLRSR